jgi:hypothetical protein
MLGTHIRITYKTAKQHSMSTLCRNIHTRTEIMRNCFNWQNNAFLSIPNSVTTNGSKSISWPNNWHNTTEMRKSATIRLHRRYHKQNLHRRAFRLWQKRNKGPAAKNGMTLGFIHLRIRKFSISTFQIRNVICFIYGISPYRAVNILHHGYKYRSFNDV